MFAKRVFREQIDQEAGDKKQLVLPTATESGLRRRALATASITDPLLRALTENGLIDVWVPGQTADFISLSDPETVDSQTLLLLRVFENGEHQAVHRKTSPRSRGIKTRPFQDYGGGGSR
jgi:hypothetical protein